MENNAHVEPIEFKDFKDKTTYHLKIEGNGKKHFISIGKKTYNAVKDVITTKNGGKK